MPWDGPRSLLSARARPRRLMRPARTTTSPTALAVDRSARVGGLQPSPGGSAMHTPDEHLFVPRPYEVLGTVYAAWCATRRLVKIGFTMRPVPIRAKELHVS